MAEYRAKRGDRPEYISGTVGDVNGPVDISDATRIRVLARGPIPSKVRVLDVDASALPETGRWRYDWADDDLALDPGAYQVEVRLYWPSGRRLTSPTLGFEDLIVGESHDEA